MLPLTSAVSSCFAASSLAALFLRVGNTPRDATILFIYVVAADDGNNNNNNNEMIISGGR